MKAKFFLILLVPLLLGLSNNLSNQNVGRIGIAAAVDPGPTPDIQWWKLSEGSGTTLAADVGIAGTTNASWVAGASGLGSALAFNGTTQLASSNTSLAFSSATTITVTFWAYLNDTTSTQGVTNTAPNPAIFPGAFNVYLTGGVIGAQLVWTTGTRVETATAPATGGWVFVTLVLDVSTTDGDVKVYFNAVEQSTTVTVNTLAGPAHFNDAALFVGAYGGSAFFLNGRIDDFRIYAGALSGANIFTLYAAGAK